MLRNHTGSYFGSHALIGLWALLSCFNMGAWAQSMAPSESANTPFSIRATQILGLEDTKSNRDGTLSIQDDALQFRRGGNSGAQVKIASIRDVFLDEESKQVGGLPMTLGKTAAPFGTGRVVSVFAHKNYDILTLEYVDNNGGIHGAIFQLSKGEGELVRHELLARGVSPSCGEDQATKHSTAEVTHENK